jgi:hypothetical protein
LSRNNDNKCERRLWTREENKFKKKRKGCFFEFCSRAFVIYLDFKNTETVTWELVIWLEECKKAAFSLRAGYG